MAKRKLKVALFYGGTSKEREVSLESGKNVFSNLDRKKYDVEKIEVTKDPSWVNRNLSKIIKSDVAFLALHGPGGEDGTVQGVLELFGIKYTCSNVMSSALAMNKAMTKRIVSAEGIAIAPHILIRKDHYLKHRVSYLKQIKGKSVVKPNHIGSSVGVIISDKPEEIKKGIQDAFKQDNEVLVEHFISGREFTVPVLGNYKLQALPVIEIVPKVSDFFDFKAKYAIGGSDEIVPAKISKELTQKLQEIALFVHRILGCRGITRTDFIVTDQGEIYFLEINTIPGMTPNSLVPKSAAAATILFPELLDKLINLALDKE